MATKQQITNLLHRLMDGGWADEQEATIDDVWNEVASRTLSRRDVELYHEGRSSVQLRSFVAALKSYAPNFEISIWGVPDADGGEEPVTYQIHTNINGANMPLVVTN